MTANGDILSELGSIISDIFTNFRNGLLFFGGPLDIVIAALDILATALVIYYVLKVLRDSRAWQLLKGVLLIIAFAIICSLVGLTTVGFLFNNTISVLAIAFVIIFQPELRRALEAVGRNSFNVISSAISQEEPGRSSGSVHNLIESIVRASEKLAETRTGALVIIERQTRLGELVEQENVVQLDAAVSATMLMQIFYKGSPLHDGAALIRDGRLTAARIHVPLSDNYHLRKDYGTRHRAAIGASEMGDAIAVVVSEERGCISLAIEGRIYTLENGDALRTLLHKLLGTPRTGGTLGLIGSLFKNSRLKKGTAAEADVPKKSTKRMGSRISNRQRILLMVASLAISLVLWLYVQVTVNPVDTRSFSVPLTTRNLSVAESNGYAPQIPQQSILVILRGREKTISELTIADIEAYIDLANVNSTGEINLDVEIGTSGLTYFERITISPDQVTIGVSNKTN